MVPPFPVVSECTTLPEESITVIAAPETGVPPRESRTMTLVVAVAETVVVGEVDDEVGEAHATAEKTTIVKIENRYVLGIWAPNGKPGTFQEILNMDGICLVRASPEEAGR